ncbi:MAG: hypothetical protein EA367_07765 [Leptolyngbya sp. DLM2.Bin15]|nr:MAG: hypothetical protein EA367_07765 [Leptolyngbya sp. DLM2.Bin15]
MTSQPDQIQALIREIDGVLSKASPRLPWVMSAEAAEQRNVLEQTRRSLLALQQQMQAEPSAAPAPSGTPPMMTEESAQRVLQAFLQEMNYLRSNMLQPLRADIDRLNRERDALVQDVKQLQAQRQQMALPAADQTSMIDSFLKALMNRLQETLSEQIAQTLSQYEQEERSLPGSPEAAALPAADLMPLSPSQRLARIQQTQARSDQLLLKLDATLQVIFESLQSNIQSYEDSLSQGLEKMHSLGQQGESMFAGLVNRLAQQLGREASSYLQSSLEAERWRSPDAPANLQPRPSEPPAMGEPTLDNLSDEQIDRLLSELNGGASEAPAKPEPSAKPPFSLTDLVGDSDDDITIFQISERHPLYTPEDDDEKTIIQTREEVEAARAAQEPSKPAIASNLNNLESALDWLEHIDEDEPTPQAATEGVPTPEAIAADTDDVAIDTPETLYADDFYQSLFGENEDGSLTERSPDLDDDFTAEAPEDMGDVATDGDGVSNVPSYRFGLEEDEVLNDDLNDDLFGGLSDPAEQQAGEQAGPEDVATRDLDASDADASDADLDLNRDESLSGLSTQALQDLFPDNEPLFPDYDDSQGTEAIAFERDEEARLGFFDTDAPVTERDLVLDDVAQESDSDLTDGAQVDPEDMITRLTDLIEPSELPSFLDTSQSLTGDDDRYMPASPDEDLLGGEDLDVPPSELIQIDDTTLNQLETDLSSLENPDSPFPIDPNTELSATLDRWDEAAAPWMDEVDLMDDPNAMPDAHLDEESTETTETLDEALPDRPLDEASDDMSSLLDLMADADDALSYDLEADHSNLDRLGDEDLAETDEPQSAVDDHPDDNVAPPLNNLADVWAALRETPSEFEDAEDDTEGLTLDAIGNNWEDTADYVTSTEQLEQEDALADEDMTADVFGGWEADALTEEATVADRPEPEVVEGDRAPHFPDTSEFAFDDDDSSLFGAGFEDEPGGVFEDFGSADLLSDEAEALFDADDTQVHTVDVDDLLLPDEPAPAETPASTAADQSAGTGEPGEPIPVAQESWLDDDADTIEGLLLSSDTSDEVEEEAIAPPAVDPEATLGDWFLFDEDDVDLSATPDDDALIETLLHETPEDEALEEETPEEETLENLENVLEPDRDASLVSESDETPEFAVPEPVGETLSELFSEPETAVPPPLDLGDEFTLDTLLERVLDGDSSLPDALDTSAEMPATAEDRPTQTPETGETLAGWFDDEVEDAPTEAALPSDRFDGLTWDDDQDQSFNDDVVSDDLGNDDVVNDDLDSMFGDASILDEPSESMDSLFGDFDDEVADSTLNDFADAFAEDKEPAQQPLPEAATSLDDLFGDESADAEDTFGEGAELPPSDSGISLDDLFGDASADLDDSLDLSADLSADLSTEIETSPQYTIDDLDDLFGTDDVPETPEKKSP